MRQWIWAVLLMIAMGGCAPQQGPETYSVLFDGAPSLFDSNVYSMGERIGEILERRTGANLAVQLDLTVDPERRSLLTESTVFVVSAGRLTLVSLNAYGAPAAPGTLFAGFGSKTALNLFKIRHLMGQTAAAARVRAERLAAGFSAS